MSECCEGNNTEVLSIILGYATSSEMIKKSLWWITRDLKNTENEIIVVDDGNCGDIKKELEKYLSRTMIKIIKVNNDKLFKNFKISSLKQSPKLSYLICEKFSQEKKIRISSKTIFNNFSIVDFAKKINKEKILEMKTFLIPLYIQEAITEYSSNFCNYLAKECKKFPIYDEDYPAKREDFITSGYIGNYQNKEKEFTEYECFYFESNDEEKEHLNEIDLNLIEDILE